METKAQEENLHQSNTGDSLTDLHDKNTDESNQVESNVVESTTVEDDEFKSDDWLDLLDNKEILKRTLFTKVTDPDNPNLPRVNRGCRVRINLQTKVYSTQQTIDSESFENLEVIVGDYDVMHGIDLILPMMHLHEIARVVINPRFGYGSKGRLPDVEPNCRLDCVVEILHIDDDLDSLSLDEKNELVAKKKARGNFWFGREEFQTAISCYRRCVEIFENLNETELNESTNRLLIDCYNNLSITQFKTDQLNAALESVDKALAYDEKNVKSLYRKAQILEKKNDLEDAVELLKVAIELEPNNSSVANLLIKLRKRRLIELENEKKLYQKMISTDEQQTFQTVENKNYYGTSDTPLLSNKSTNSANQKVSKKFNYVLFASSAIIALIIASLISYYKTNYN